METMMDGNTQEDTGDPILCPVKEGAAVAQILLKIPGTTLDSPICIFFEDRKFCIITQATLIKEFRSATTEIGDKILCCKAEGICTYSVRPAVSMSMLLDNVPIFLIMLSVRWSLDALLEYIRKQVMNFNKGLSSRMIINNIFHTLPDMRISLFGPSTINHEYFATQLSMSDSSEMRVSM